MFSVSDMKDLEHKVREAVSHGQPRTHRPWKKILIVVEGVYRCGKTVVMGGTKKKIGRGRGVLTFFVINALYRPPSRSKWTQRALCPIAS